MRNPYYTSICFALILLVGCASAPSVPKCIIVRNKQYGGPFRIVSRDFSPSRMTYVLKGERGIFSFDILPAPASVKTVKFILKDQRNLESLSIDPEDENWISLYSPNTPPPKGITVVKKGNDWHATFVGHGLDLLRKGGRFQVIDEYR